MKSVVKIA